MKLGPEPSNLVPQRKARPKPVGSETIGIVLAAVRKEVKQYDLPIVTFVANTAGDPFKVLISTMLSLRTKDLTTAAATERLFAKAQTPQQMMHMDLLEIEKLIYPVLYYRNKAKAIKETCRILVQEHGSKVPDDIDTLITLPGVGRKTANLVMTLGYKKHAMCVDTHVHRISNIWGYVQSRNPHETEKQLRERLPRRYWMEYNDLLVSFGQHVCVPVSPKCTQCPVFKLCPRIGVTRSR
jgi:endonuclease III